MKICPGLVAEAWRGLWSPTGGPPEGLVVPSNILEIGTEGSSNQRKKVPLKEERSQKLSTVTFKTGRSPGRRRTFSPTGFRSGCMNPWPPWPSAGGRSPLRSLPSALPWGEVSRNHTPVPESLPNSGNNTFGAVRRKKYHLQIRI